MRGTYVLLARMPQDTQLEVGRLGVLKFEEGLYAYVGSALGGLKNRVKRHLRNKKKTHWHIDYFLTEAQVVSVIYGESRKRKECAIAKNLAKSFPGVQGFGSSDCSCKSHLFFSKNGNMEEEVIGCFKKVGMRPLRW